MTLWSPFCPPDEPDGRIRDTASARLAGIRAAIVRLRRDVVRRLEELVRARPEVLADGYVTEKGGRYCLPVRSDRRESVAGIVHEKSGSGQTLFVEPLAVAKILKGTKPSALPVETTDQIILTVNPGAATKMGVTLSDALTKQATKVVE